MRSVSFAGLHRILTAVANHPNGLAPKEINDLVLNQEITLTPGNPRPAPTTLYHYRNTLLRLQLLKRVGTRLQANTCDPNVHELLRAPVPANHDQALNATARDLFAGLVLRNEQCRSLFFDLFMPQATAAISAAHFRLNSVSVDWWHRRSSDGKTEVVLQNGETLRAARCMSHVSKSSVMYGLRYWARDELQLVDEYCAPSGGTTTMFPLAQSDSPSSSYESSVNETVQFLLTLRTSHDWTMFSIYDLIGRCCEAQRKPKRLLFGAIDWLLNKWPHHIVLIPTSPTLATLNARAIYRDDFALRRYYRHGNGPYISHVRVHKHVSLDCPEGT